MKRLGDGFKGEVLSEATARMEDLVPACVGFLQSVKQVCEIVSEVDNIAEEAEKLQLVEKPGYGEYYSDKDDIDGNTSEELAMYLFHEDIFDLLNDIAPEGYGFGSHPGDGVCYGFWECEEEA